MVWMLSPRRKFKVVVKLVSKKRYQLIDYIYIVVFRSRSVTLYELREKAPTMFYTVVHWEYQYKLKNQYMQCRRCQIYAHGESNGAVTVNCTNCAGLHRTSESTSDDAVKYGNCGGIHKSYDFSCPYRAKSFPPKVATQAIGLNTSIKSNATIVNSRSTAVRSGPTATVLYYMLICI